MKAKYHPLSLLSICLLPILGSVAQAKSERPERTEKGAHFAQLDSDGNQSISRAEAEAAEGGRLLEHFDTIDADGDGSLSQDELRAKAQERRQQNQKKRNKLRELDTDGNRAISYDEAAAGDAEKLVEHFDKIDADGDGEITAQEFQKMRRAMQKREQPEAE